MILYKYMHFYGDVQEAAISKEKYLLADNNDFSIFFVLYTVSVFIDD